MNFLFFFFFLFGQKLFLLFFEKKIFHFNLQVYFCVILVRINFFLNQWKNVKSHECFLFNQMNIIIFVYDSLKYIIQVKRTFKYIKAFFLFSNFLFKLRNKEIYLVLLFCFVIMVVDTRIMLFCVEDLMFNYCRILV